MWQYDRKEHDKIDVLRFVSRRTIYKNVRRQVNKSFRHSFTHRFCISHRKDNVYAIVGHCEFLMQANDGRQRTVGKIIRHAFGTVTRVVETLLVGIAVEKGPNYSASWHATAGDRRTTQLQVMREPSGKRLLASTNYRLKKSASLRGMPYTRHEFVMLAPAHLSVR